MCDVSQNFKYLSYKWELKNKLFWYFLEAQLFGDYLNKTWFMYLYSAKLEVIWKSEKSAIERILHQRLKPTFFWKFGCFLKNPPADFRTTTNYLRHSWLPKHCLLLPVENFSWEQFSPPYLRCFFGLFSYCILWCAPPEPIDGRPWRL